jgi:competence protein ComEC
VLGGRQAAADWGGRAGDLFSAVFEWLAARLGEEADAARLAPWLAVCFGIGILLYFAAPAEPSLYAPVFAIVLFGALAWASRERPFAFAFALALTALPRVSGRDVCGGR